MALKTLLFTCNVITFIDVSYKLFEVCQRVYRAGGVVPVANACASSLTQATVSLSNSIKKSLGTSGARTGTNGQQELLQTATKCEETAKQIGAEYKKLK